MAHFRKNRCHVSITAAAKGCFKNTVAILCFQIIFLPMLFPGFGTEQSHERTAIQATSHASPESTQVFLPFNLTVLMAQRLSI
jgi:hypothetical protein